VKIGRLFGIEITVNPSWVLIFALVAYAVGSPNGPLQSEKVTPLERALLGILGSLLFFTSVLLHELAHSLLARSRGVPVKGITLFIFGGVSSLDGEPATAPSAAWIAAIGPLTSMALALAFYGLALATGTTPIAMLFAYLAFANVVLAVFNVLPAYPLDGGRVLHAVVWRMTGDRLRATRVAATIGGIVSALYASFNGLWLTFIGWYLLQSGNVERRQSEVASSLSGHMAGELIVEPSLRIGADETADRVLRTMQETRTRVLPVYVGERFIGFVSIDDMAKVPADELARTFVTAIMTRAADAVEIPAGADANDAVRQMAATGSQALAVVSTGGELVGILTRESIMHWLARQVARVK
jgi:Zn-dependent protease/predicted transcriptional regulator